MTPCILEEVSTELIDLNLFVIMSNALPPKDPDEDEDDDDDEGEDDGVDEPPVVREPDED